MRLMPQSCIYCNQKARVDFSTDMDFLLGSCSHSSSPESRTAGATYCWAGRMRKVEFRFLSGNCTARSSDPRSHESDRFSLNTKRPSRRTGAPRGSTGRIPQCTESGSRSPRRAPGGPRIVLGIPGIFLGAPRFCERYLGHLSVPKEWPTGFRETLPVYRETGLEHREPFSKIVPSFGKGGNFGSGTDSPFRNPSEPTPTVVPPRGPDVLCRVCRGSAEDFNWLPTRDLVRCPSASSVDFSSSPISNR